MTRIRTDRTIWFAAGAVVSLLMSTLALQAWRADAAPGDDDTTFVPITPCRLVDTRPAPQRVGPSGTLTATDTTIVQATGSNGNCVLPADAVGLSMNVTALNATELSFLTFWPDGPLPLAASLNPAPGEPPTPNAVTVDLSPTGSFNIYNASGNVDVVVDVTGYHTSSSLKEIQQRLLNLENAVANPSTQIIPISFRATSANDAPLASLNGITVQVDCPVDEETIEVTTTKNGGEISSSSHDVAIADFHGEFDDSFDAGETFVAGPGGGNPAHERHYTIHYSAPDGKDVTVWLATEDDIGTDDCIVSGFAMGAR